MKDQQYSTIEFGVCSIDAAIKASEIGFWVYFSEREYYYKLKSSSNLYCYINGEYRLVLCFGSEQSSPKCLMHMYGPVSTKTIIDSLNKSFPNAYTYSSNPHMKLTNNYPSGPSYGGSIAHYIAPPKYAVSGIDEYLRTGILPHTGPLSEMLYPLTPKDCVKKDPDKLDESLFTIPVINLKQEDK